MGGSTLSKSLGASLSSSDWARLREEDRGVDRARTQGTWKAVAKSELFSEGNGEPVKSLSRGVTRSDLISLFLCVF